MIKKITLWMVIGTALFLLSGCNTQQMNGVAQEFRDLRHLVPKSMRRQIFNNTPTGELAEIEEMTPYGMVRYKEQATNGYNDDSYGQGFEDGCGNMVGIIGAGPMRLRKSKFDADRLVTDQWYLRGYQDASSFCTFSLDWETH